MEKNKLYKDETFAQWLILTSDLIEKYDLQNLSVKVEGKYIRKDNEFIGKSLAKISIKNNEDEFIIKNEYYDILQTNEDKEGK